jgi:hypothetical protein
VIGVSKADEYREQLTELRDWKPFLLQNSGLPGPRGNLELAKAFADLADKETVSSYLAIPSEDAPENSAQVFLVFCAITALGKMVVRGERKHIATLRPFAHDPRWRVREAVAIALQYVGDSDLSTLFATAEAWSTGDWYEKRAVAAALAEPRLLKQSAAAHAVLNIFDKITRDIAAAGPGDESFKVLRQSMGYCWSVAVAASPKHGKALMEKWLRSPNADVRWIMKENLKKNRLAKMDAAWVERCTKALEKAR